MLEHRPRIDRRLCVAPMMDWTDRHCRFFLRQITRRALLYTEMVTTGAVLHGDRARLIGFDPAEHPVALQLGGADAGELAEAAAIGEAFGYDEINLNVGCPSDRVQNGRFGACLMAEPETVAAGVAAMARAVSIPVTVKTRIGIDDRDSYEDLRAFVEAVAAAGCETIIVHARKAWLSGLSPKENREIPPLQYDRVYRLKEDFPALEIVINGGIGNLDEAGGHLERVDGVMLGRAAYQRPFLLAEADRRFFDADEPLPERGAVALAMRDYAARRRAEGVPVKAITRHMMGLFHGQPGGRLWRRVLSEEAQRPDAGATVIDRALEAVESAGRRLDAEAA